MKIIIFFLNSRQTFALLPTLRSSVEKRRMGKIGKSNRVTKSPWQTAPDVDTGCCSQSLGADYCCSILDGKRTGVSFSWWWTNSNGSVSFSYRETPPERIFKGVKMSTTNADCVKPEMIQKYAYAIRHFRGYLDKEKFDDDLAFLMNFVQEVSSPRHENGELKSTCSCGR